MAAGESKLFPEDREPLGVLRLDSYGPEAVFSEFGLATLAGVDVQELQAAVERKELPRPFNLLGQRCWLQGQLVDHLETRACLRKKEGG